jgi:hypothetical protein
VAHGLSSNRSERILGSSDFLEGYRRAGAAATPTPLRLVFDALITRVCRHVGVPPAALARNGRTPALTRARAGIAHLWVEEYVASYDDLCSRPPHYAPPTASRCSRYPPPRHGAGD